MHTIAQSILLAIYRCSFQTIDAQIERVWQFDFCLFLEIKFYPRGRKFKANKEVVKTVEAQQKEVVEGCLKFVL